MRRRLAACVALCLVVGLACAAEPPSGDAHGIRVRAACYQGARLLVDLSCERAMDCWSDTAAMGVLDLETGRRVSAPANDLVYVDARGGLLSDPPMQGVIRAVWTFGLGSEAPPRRVQLAQGDETATSAFEPAADCAALPAAAVKRLAGG